MSESFIRKIEERLTRIYSESVKSVDVSQVACQIERLCQPLLDGQTSYTLGDEGRWSEKDSILITYANSIQTPGEIPLQTLSAFLEDNLHGTINNIHILPFFPYSSDDGFSVIDYRLVNPDWGDWQDIARIAGKFDLMVGGMVLLS